MNRMHSLGHCAACDKQMWPTKQAAKNAARTFHPGDHLAPYRCPVNERVWHYGHMNPLLITRGMDIGRG